MAGKQPDASEPDADEHLEGANEAPVDEITLKPRRHAVDRGERKRRMRNETCPMCHQTSGFLWSCPCGFAICDLCMKQERWGMTCNNLTWVCPDCGTVRSY